jgi:hypothetical protein
MGADPKKAEKAALLEWLTPIDRDLAKLLGAWHTAEGTQGSTPGGQRQAPVLHAGPGGGSGQPPSGRGRGHKPPDDQREESLSDRKNKRRLEDLPMLRKLVPDHVRRKKFGEWLERNHGAGEPHDHLDDHEVEELVRQWQEEEGITEEEDRIRKQREMERGPKERQRKTQKMGGGGSDGQGGGTGQPTGRSGGAGGETGKPTGGGATGGGADAPAGPKPPAEPRSVEEIEAELQRRRAERAAVEDALNEKVGIDKRGKGLSRRTDEQLLDILERESERNPQLKEILEGEHTQEWVRLARERREAIRRRQSVAKARREHERQERAQQERRERTGLTGGREDHTKGTGDAKMAQAPAEPPATKGSGDPTSTKSGGEPKPPPATPAKTSVSPATPPQSFDASKFQQSVAEVFRQAEAQKKAFDDIQRRLEKSRSPAETKQLREKRGKLGEEIKGKTRVEIEKLAKQLASAPEMAGVAPGTPTEMISKGRERFSKVASGGRAIGNALSQLQNAFVLVESVAEILSARSATEAITATLKAEANIAASAGEYALFEYALGSVPAAIFAAPLVGMKDDHSEGYHQRQAKEERLRAKQKLVDSFLRKEVAAYDPDHTDGDRELRDEVVREFDQMRREHVLQQAKDRGIGDGLSRNKTSEHELEDELWPTDEDRIDLGITPEDRMLAYQEGLAEGKSQRPGAIVRGYEPAIKCAHDLGFKDGKDGKAANSEAVKKWPELRALAHNAEDLRAQDKLDNDEFRVVEAVAHAFERSYDEGYQEGQKAGKAMVVEELQISPNGFTIGAYTSRLLTATLVFSDKSTKDVTGEVHWKSSDDNFVKISVTPNGRPYAAIGRNGGAQVTASYAGFFGSHEKTVKIAVNPPRIAVRPDKITLRVGEEQRFSASSLADASDPGQLAIYNLDSSVIAWGSDDSTKISIDADGNARVLAASDHPVTIMASDKFGVAQGRAIVTIR